MRSTREFARKRTASIQGLAFVFAVMFAASVSWGLPSYEPVVIDEVAPDHFAPCDSPMQAIADDEGPGAR